MSSSPASTRPEPSRAELRTQVRAAAENRPGIYRFTGARGDLLYVGKSVRVRSRLLSYFRAREGKPAELLRVAHGVEWEYLPNEFEALLREFQLIRVLRPRLNVQHRRDRRFAWVKLTRERAPRLVATGRPARDGQPAFGPIPASRSLPRTLRDLAHVAGLRDCPGATPIHFSDQMDLLAEDRAPLCPRYEMESCPAPCAARCTEKEYLVRVRSVLSFLGGRENGLLDRLEERTRAAADRQAFELAALHRDRAAGIRRLRDLIVETREHLDSLTFVYRVPGRSGAGRAYLVRSGFVRSSFDDPLAGEGDLPAVGTAAERHRLARALRAELDTVLPTPRSLGAAEREELFLVARWFRRNPDERARTMEPERYLELLAGEGRPPAARPVGR